jgi:hypothetical protein
MNTKRTPSILLSTHGVTHDVVARDSGVSRHSVYSQLAGRRPLSDAVRASLVRLLGRQDAVLAIAAIPHERGSR